MPKLKDPNVWFRDALLAAAPKPLRLAGLKTVVPSTVL